MNTAIVDITFAYVSRLRSTFMSHPSVAAIRTQPYRRQRRRTGIHHAFVPPVLSKLDALLEASLKLARTAPTGRLALARLAEAAAPEWLDEEIAAELAAASAAAREPVPWKRVEKVLREAWGCNPADELDDLETEPAAVTPTSQVHRGELAGRPVAAKVLRPGLALAVRQDLALLDALARPLGAAFPALDAAAVLREVRARVLEELDLEHEAEVQRRFHRALRGSEAFVVPAPVLRLARESVMVSDWVDGVPLARADDRDRACALLVAFVLGSGRFGVIYADPQPEHVLVTAEGRLAILDFGATRSVPEGRIERLADAVDAFAAADGVALGAVLHELGWLPAAEGPGALELARYISADLAGEGPARLDSPAVVAARDRLFERPSDVEQLLSAGSLAAEDLWAMRAGAQLFATIARVGASGDWLALAQDAARRGWDAAEPPLRRAA
jgi:hypothetical protein